MILTVLQLVLNLMKVIEWNNHLQGIGSLVSRLVSVYIAYADSGPDPETSPESLFPSILSEQYVICVTVRSTAE